MPLTNQPVKGMYLLEEGRFYFLIDRQLKTQGRQGGLIILKMKSLENGSDNSSVYLMDSETYETITIPKGTIGEYVNFLKEGDSILIMIYNGKVLSIKENPTVILAVVDTSAAVKGNTANSATKEATLETGYKIQVPMFIKTGDVIKVNTDSGTYSGKAN